MNEALILLRELLTLSGLATEIVEDIIKESWEKVFINIGINAIGTLTRLRNGQLLEHESIKNLMRETVEEALKIAKFKEISFPEKDYVDLTYDVAEKTYNNKNSMLQDILKGKKTEIDFINGRIVEYAKMLGERVPLNEMLTSLIKGLEVAVK